MSCYRVFKIQPYEDMRADSRAALFRAVAIVILRIKNPRNASLQSSAQSSSQFERDWAVGPEVDHKLNIRIKLDKQTSYDYRVVLDTWDFNN